MSVEQGKEIWSDGHSFAGRLHLQEEQARERRLRQIVRLRSMSRDADQNAFVNLLEQIDSSTIDAEAANERKVAVAVEQRFNLRATALVHKPVAYLAAGVDIAFPLSLGARDVLMVDTDFADFPLLDEIAEKVSTIGKITQRSRDGLEFIANTGNGPQEMRIRTSSEDARTFVPGEPLGGVIEMAGIRDGALVRPNVANHLVQNAVIANFDFVPPERVPGRGSSFNFTDAGLVPIQGKYTMLHRVADPAQLQRFAEYPRYY